MRKVKFSNGFKAIFEGCIKKTYKSPEGIVHHQIINQKLIKKSKYKTRGINVNEGYDLPHTLLDSHIIK